MEKLINALKKFDDLETVIVKLKVCDKLNELSMIFELTDYLNDEAIIQGSSHE